MQLIERLLVYMWMSVSILLLAPLISLKTTVSCILRIVGNALKSDILVEKQQAEAEAEAESVPIQEGLSRQDARFFYKQDAPIGDNRNQTLKRHRVGDRQYQGRGGDRKGVGGTVVSMGNGGLAVVLVFGVTLVVALVVPYTLDLLRS